MSLHLVGETIDTRQAYRRAQAGELAPLYDAEATARIAAAASRLRLPPIARRQESAVAAVEQVKALVAARVEAI